MRMIVFKEILLYFWKSVMLTDYLLNAEKYWPESHRRNAVKLKKFLYYGAGGKERKAVESYIESIKELAKLRERFSSKHVYLINTGSAGSHWIEAMLSLLPEFYNGGEVYFPQVVKNYLSEIDPSDANRFLDAVYLIHTGGIYKNSLCAMLSNSAHLADHEQLSRFSLNKKTVLLVRNPVDVVVSRTFRKDEYKKDIAPALDDKEYLERNCEYVEKFYKKIKNYSFDEVIRYEDFVSSPIKSLRSLADAIGLEASESDIFSAVEKTSKEEVEQSVKKGEQAITNIYLGERKDYGWARDYLNNRFEELLIKYKY